MQKRRLGSSDLEVPVICLGTMNWGQQNTEQQAHEQLDYAIEERRLDFIDTAEIYPVPLESSKQGRTETYIGNWLKKRRKRDDLIIATKVAASNTIKTRSIDTPPKYNRKNIYEALEGSLRRLQTDYVDLYQVHWPERSTNFFGVRGFTQFVDEETTAIEETLEILTGLVKEGKVRYIGVSNETPWGVMQYLNAAKNRGLEKIVSIQNQYSLLNRTFEIGLSEMTMKEDIGMLVYSVLNMGVLSGKYLNGAKPDGARFTLYERSQLRYNPSHAQTAIKAYINLAKNYNLDPNQLAIAFAISREFTSSVIIGATSVEQLKIDIDSADLHLSRELLGEIEKIHATMPDVTH